MAVLSNGQTMLAPASERGLFSHIALPPLIMPLRELKYPHQVIAWLEDWGGRLREPGEMILIGSAALLWHAARRGLDEPLPENSMDVDPVTDSEEIAELAYDAMIGSDFEREHGWHVNLMPPFVFDSFPDGWRERCQSA